MITEIGLKIFFVIITIYNNFKNGSNSEQKNLLKKYYMSGGPTIQEVIYFQMYSEKTVCIRFTNKIIF
jgi:hypothetical protein